MHGGNEVFAAVPDPLYRTAQAARRPEHQYPFRIKNVLHPEAATDIGNTDAKFFTGDPKHLIGQQIPDRVCSGRRGSQVQPAVRGVERSDRAARFQGSSHHAVVDEFAFHDMGGAADRRLYRSGLASLEFKRDVVFGFQPNRRASRQNCFRHRNHRGQRLVVDDDGIESVACDFNAFRNHERDRLTNMANDIASQRVIGRDDKRRRHRDLGRRTRQRADIIRGQIESGQNREDARHPARRVGEDRHNAGMRMRRADHHAVKNVGRRQIGDVTTTPPHEAVVFTTVDAAAQQRLGHETLYGTKGS